MPKGFLPQQDTGLLTATVEAPDDVSFGRMAELQAAVAAVIRADPDVTGVASVVGAGIVNPAQNMGRVSAVLRPRDARADDVRAIVARLQPKLDALAGVTVHLQPVQDIQIGARPGSTPFQYTLMAPDPVELGHWAPLLEGKLGTLPVLRDIASDQRDGGLRVTVDVDRDLAGRLGVTMQAIDDVLYDAFGQRQISTIYAQNNQYRVVLEATPELRDDPAMIGLLRVPATAGQQATVQGTPATSSGTAQVPLAEIARIGRAAGPLTVTKQGQFPAVTIGFDLAEGASLGDAVAAIRAAEAEIGMPDTISGSFAGDAAEFQRSLAGEPWLILAAIIVIYIVLGVLYESVIHPITILSTLPSAGIGALLALQLFGLDLSVVGADRHRAADGHREEERHHDDRLRAGGAARPWAHPAGSDRGGQPQALPPDHDDDAGGAARRAAAGAGERHGLGAAAAARRLRRRRPAAEPGDHPLHHTGHLPGDGGSARARPSGWRGRRGFRQPRIAVSISEPFIRRPIATALLSIGIALAGLVAYFNLPVAPLPSVDLPTIVVSASQPGADPATMSSSVAAPLERRLGAIAGVSEMTSTSSLGNTSIVIQFDLSRSVEGAARDVQAAINAAGSDLPAGLPNPPRSARPIPAMRRC